MTPFYGWGSTASGLEPLRGSSLLFTIKQLTFYTLNNCRKINAADSENKNVSGYTESYLKGRLDLSY